MEKFDLSDAICKDTFAGHLILRAMTEVAGDKAIETFGLQGGQHKAVEVEIKFNGVEVPLSVFISAWDRSRAWFAMKDVRELVRRRLGRVYNKINSVERGLNELIHAEFPDEREER